MPMIPFATFLAGALLTIFLPLAIVISIAIWYVRSFRRHPDPSDPEGGKR